MKRLTKIGLTIFILTFFYNNGFSQLSVSHYNSSLSKIGLGYNFSEKVWSELRLYTNTDIDNLTPELVVCYNIVNREKHNIYAGIGGVANYFNGIVVPIGVQFTPFEKFDKFSLHIEIQPTLDFENDPIIQSSWGLRYKFGK
ncbi:MAG: hypothetical protein M0Q12_14660 [Synergistaceae bacterium]|jgi:hypothetical protein|nr:hypothetical protein [Synergistaceae bacterium]